MTYLNDYDQPSYADAIPAHYTSTCPEWYPIVKTGKSWLHAHCYNTMTKETAVPISYTLTEDVGTVAVEQVLSVRLGAAETIAGWVGQIKVDGAIVFQTDRGYKTREKALAKARRLFINRIGDALL